jgi:hypothetical protein
MLLVGSTKRTLWTSKPRSEALEERSRAEIAHWEKEKAPLEAALRRALEMCFACKAVTAEE